MIKGLIGKKIGMTQIFDENGAAVPVTLIEAGPCFVTQVRRPDRDGYFAVQLGFGETKPVRLTGGELGHLGGELGSTFGSLGGELGHTFGSFDFRLGSMGSVLRWAVRILIIAAFVIPGIIFLRSRRRRVISS